jgi:hypothetical protein
MVPRTRRDMGGKAVRFGRLVVQLAVRFRTRKGMVANRGIPRLVGSSPTLATHVAAALRSSS